MGAGDVGGCPEHAADNKQTLARIKRNDMWGLLDDGKISGR
jgi:hypothetical protein